MNKQIEVSILYNKNKYNTFNEKVVYMKRTLEIRIIGCLKGETIENGHIDALNLKIEYQDKSNVEIFRDAATLLQSMGLSNSMMFKYYRCGAKALFDYVYPANLLLEGKKGIEKAVKDKYFEFYVDVGKEEKQYCTMSVRIKD